MSKQVPVETLSLGTTPRESASLNSGSNESVVVVSIDPYGDVSHSPSDSPVPAFNRAPAGEILMGFEPHQVSNDPSALGAPSEGPAMGDEPIPGPAMGGSQNNPYITNADYLPRRK